MAKKHYVESEDIEKCWAHWLEHSDDESWHNLQNMVYLICQGVAVKFGPKNDEEHADLTHETFILTVEKIKNGKLVFTPGRAPVFNLLTTTIHRHLFSLMNKRNRQKRLLLTKYALKPRFVKASGIDGTDVRHPDSVRLMSSVMSQIQESES